jgi:hypothetical protein
MQVTQNTKRKLTDYFLITVVLILEVNVFLRAFETPIPNMESLISFILLFYFFFRRKREFNLNFILFVSSVLLLILIQGILFGFSITTFFTYPVFTLLIPYLLYKVTGPRVFEYLVNIIYFTALLSSVIWLVQVTIPPVNDFLQYLKYSGSILTQGQIEPDATHRVSLAFIYTIPPEGSEIFGLAIMRNWGLYHEPGAFAYFLILAIGANTIIQQNFINRKNIIMSIILLTTLSTAGYLAFFFIISYAVLSSKIHISLKVLTVPLFIFITLIGFTQLDFMQEKIVSQFEKEIDDDTVFQKGGGRIWRIRAAINLLSTSPVLGRGIIPASRDFSLGSRYFFTGAGIWRTLSSYGILLAPLIFYFYYKGIRKLCLSYNFNPSFAIFFFLALSVGATSQRFFMDSITMLFFINGLILYSSESGKHDPAVL